MFILPFYVQFLLRLFISHQDLSGTYREPHFLLYAINYLHPIR